MVTAQKQKSIPAVEGVRIRVPDYPSQATVQGAVDMFIGAVRDIPGVEALVVAVHGDMIFAEVVANFISRENASRIYAAQGEVARQYRAILWDFRVTDRKGTELLSPDPERYQVIDLQLQPA